MEQAVRDGYNRPDQSQKVSHIGEKLVAKTIDEIELLTEHPEIGRIVPEFDQNDKT